MVVRIKDSQGREADRLSQEYRCTVPADKLEAARRGEVLFYREADLPPGRYTAEAVAYDALAQEGERALVHLSRSRRRRPRTSASPA